MLAVRHCTRLCHTSSAKPHVSRKTFRSLGISDALVKRLAKQKIVEPTPIQRQILPLVFGGNNVVFADQTGSGKTLCYLLPMIERILASKARISQQATNSVGVRGLVLVPNGALAEQVVKVFNMLAAADGVCAHAVHKLSPMCQTPDNALLVGTPRELAQYQGDVWENVDTVVYDEVDRLLRFDKDALQVLHNLFLKSMKKNFRKMDTGETTEENMTNDHEEDASSYPPLLPVCPQNRQFIALSATASCLARKTDITPYMKRSSRRVVTVYPKSAYRLPDSATCQFEIYDTVKEKNEILLRCLQRLVPKEEKTFFPAKDSPRAVVFTKFKNLPEVQKTLNSLKPPPPPLAVGRKKALHTEVCASCWWHNRVAYSQITSGSEAGEEYEHKALDEFNRGRRNLFISGGQEGHGVDFKNVTAVIMYDMPTIQRDFLHFAGRTARAGSKGLVIGLLQQDAMTRANQDLVSCLETDQHMQLKHLLQDRIALRGGLFHKNRIRQLASRDLNFAKEVEQFGQALKRLAAAGSCDVENWGDIDDEDIPLFKNLLSTL